VLTLTDRLSAEGYAVETTADGESALERATAEAFDLILLDVMLPRLSGFDVLRDLRRRSVETPVIMLTARGQVIDKVVGLKLGADDYVTKPFEMMELLARIEAKLRRAPAAGGGGARRHSLSVRCDRHRFSQGGSHQGRAAARPGRARVPAAALLHRAPGRDA